MITPTFTAFPCAKAGRTTIGAASSEAVPASRVRRFNSTDRIGAFFVMDAYSLYVVLVWEESVTNYRISQAD
jgi:hypothetical protein